MLVLIGTDTEPEDDAYFCESWYC